MYEVLKAGGLTGGFNFDAKNRRPSNTPEDMFHAYILAMDTYALGLIKAAELIEDGALDAFVEQRYESWQGELGQRIRKGETTLEELAARAATLGTCPLPDSGRQEYLESVVNRVMFG
jgi:xylose isomerase